jgi:hypothetical protein
MSDEDLFAVPARARRTDPPTSHRAAREVTPHTDNIRAEVERWALGRGAEGFIDEELSAAFDAADSSSYRTRRAELTWPGVIVDSGRHRMNSNARQCMVWMHRSFRGQYAARKAADARRTAAGPRQPAGRRRRMTDASTKGARAGCRIERNGGAYPKSPRAAAARKKRLGTRIRACVLIWKRVTRFHVEGGTYDRLHLKPFRAPSSTETQPAVRVCPNCAASFAAGGRGLGKTFCSKDCRVAFNNRAKAEGAVMSALVKCWLANRHAKPGTREAELCRRARAELTEIGRMFHGRGRRSRPPAGCGLRGNAAGQRHTLH